VRVANVGRSAVITPTGRVTWAAADDAPTSHVAEVAWSDRPTWYVRHGVVTLWLGLICLLAVGVLGRRPEPPQPSG